MKFKDMYTYGGGKVIIHTFEEILNYDLNY